MNTPPIAIFKGFAASLIFLALSTAAPNSLAQSTGGTQSKPAALQEKYVELSQALSKNQFKRPIVLESTETGNNISSNAYAVIDTPFEVFSAALKKPTSWCEILILHINTKYCHGYSDNGATTLKVNIGKKSAQALADTFSVDFSYRLLESSANYLAVQLTADKGPLSTTDYRLELQAVPVTGSKTFMFLRYSYGFGSTGRFAMQTYLATLGRGKIGFTQVAQEPKPSYIGGMRGAVERNTMRYYLAIEAYFAAMKLQASGDPMSARFNYWFDSTEQYAEQLREVDKASYLSMKKDEYQRQQEAPPKQN